jgi:dolichol-phosphate mannosyltransferase
VLYARHPNPVALSDPVCSSAMLSEGAIEHSGGSHTPVTLLAPAYNEEAVLEQFCAIALTELGPDWELLLVDDGSVDKTREIAARFADRDERVRVVTHPQNRGLGAALATGFANARGDIVITLDADLSHPFELVPAMLSKLADADIVYASRFVPGGSMVGIPWWRVVTSHFANRVLRIVFATTTHDLTSGFRGYRSAALRDLRVRAHSFAAQLEITVRAQAAGLRIAEVPLVLRGRVAGTSKMRYLALIPRYAMLTLWLLGVRWLGHGRTSPGSRPTTLGGSRSPGTFAQGRRDPVEDPAAP